MKKSSIGLSIKRPCSENFEKFTKTEQGGFCESCCKEVIDFSKMSDNELLNYFNTSNGKTCGRFNVSQLKTYELTHSIKKSETKSFIKYSLMGFSLVSLLSINNGYSQKKTKDKFHVLSKSNEVKNDSIALKDTNFLTGVITDNKGEPLIGVNVYIKGTKKGTITDFDGNYSFSKDIIKDDTVLVASYLGFDTIEFKASDLKKSMKVDKKMIEMTCVFMGEVTTEKIYTSKPSFFKRLFGWVKK